ncbi:eCIS core domain-containing protein [Streptomyces sp. AC154]|uniref:eCIS core domain-containing protein n=1 Tax=Streptomyces sp. AC154 TaxID=3143184 RepID=UPI003F803539
MGHRRDKDRTGRAETERPSVHPSAQRGDQRLPGLMALQRGIGNRAVVETLRRSGHAEAQERDGDGETSEALPSAVQRSTVHKVLNSGGRPLDDSTRTSMEARLGADLSDVRVHDDSAARASATELGARAYTSGSHVVIGAGGADRLTLAHELTHVLQQRSGPVAGTDNGAGLNVSDPSDRFEREAESNARRVMAGPAPDLATEGGETAGHPHPAHAVQRLPAGAGDRTTASPAVQRVAAEGLTLGANTSGVSRASDPAFEEEAEAFERKLAAKASSHAAANGALADMAAKAKAYIRSGVGGAWDHADQRLAEIFKTVGQEGVKNSGFVGTAVSDVMAVFDEGTLSERYTHIVRFFTEVLARDLAGTEKREEIDEQMRQAQLNVPLLQDRRRAIEKAVQKDKEDREAKEQAGEKTEADPKMNFTRHIAPVPKGSAVEHQGDARVRRDAVMKEIDPDADIKDIGLGGHTVAQTGLEFSDRQNAMHTKDDPAWDKEQDALKWAAGARVWMIKEENSWVEAQRKLSLPLGGGPSGTTNTMMSAAKLLGADNYGARLASIGFLIGASHHTLVEIMAAAEPFGCAYDPTQGIYRNISPLTEEELRSCGRDGKFPGETASAGTGSVA